MKRDISKGNFQVVLKILHANATYISFFISPASPQNIACTLLKPICSSYNHIAQGREGKGEGDVKIQFYKFNPNLIKNTVEIIRKTEQLHNKRCHQMNLILFVGVEQSLML
jgi:hypothetical protein